MERKKWPVTHLVPLKGPFKGGISYNFIYTGYNPSYTFIRPSSIGAPFFTPFIGSGPILWEESFFFWGGGNGEKNGYALW